MDCSSIIVLVGTVLNISATVFGFIYFNRKKASFAEKQKAIHEALETLDDFFSTFLIDGLGGKVVSTRLKPGYLTTKARDALNGLYVYCKDATLPGLFLDILITPELIVDTNPSRNGKIDIGKKLLKYSEFRNTCRKELGLREIDMPKDWIFINRISNPDLF
jgi:hypothetical protein